MYAPFIFQWRYSEDKTRRCLFMLFST
uniref:Uncharacterized protein n=1 Tax=Anguilla anguilla TaxID=7936 RepID=A0A0E9VN33_ANGAN